ncbi:hypothetical protein QCA50_012703 [Cerrena zonata]|uniref:Protein kinase domain-containing protein n=1 Tax=Cerrena zonata TaxID=2478898 RepID=A0AAW0G351_9APHY
MQGIVHRDIKPANLLVNSENVVKISDFGVSFASSLNTNDEVSEVEFELAKDLLTKLLDKDATTRIDIPDIKNHPFVLMDLEEDLDLLNELFFLNDTNGGNLLNEDAVSKIDLTSGGDIVLQSEIDNAVVGVGSKIKKSIVEAIKSKDSKAIKDFAQRMENSYSSSSGEDSAYDSKKNSYSALQSANRKALQTSTPPRSISPAGRPNLFGRHGSSNFDPFTSAPHVPSGLSSQQHADSLSSIESPQAPKGQRPSNILLQEVIESHSPATSRRGSSAGLTEAPQIETKRNVGGDLYLKNQSIVDTFKGIQQQDDKRRRSSIFSNGSIPQRSRHSSIAGSDDPTSSRIRVMPPTSPQNIPQENRLKFQ